MFIEVTAIDVGPMLLNLHHVISISSAASVGGGCFVVTVDDMKYRVKESLDQLKIYTMPYNDKSCIG